MTLRARATLMIRERMSWPRGSIEWEWKSAAAWTYLQMAAGVPANEWTKYGEKQC